MAVCVDDGGNLKKAFFLGFIIAISLITGGGIGWWANSPGMDLMCSKPFVTALAEDIEAQGIFVKAGTLVNLRSCEYAERFTINLYYPKNPENPLFLPKNSAPNLGNHGAEQYLVNKIGP